MSASFIGFIAANELVVTQMTSGTIASGDTLSGPGVATGQTIGTQSSGVPGGAGSYHLGISQASVVSSNFTTAATVLFPTAALIAELIVTRNAINATIIANNQGKITGPIMNTDLNDIVQNIIDIVNAVGAALN